MKNRPQGQTLEMLAAGLELYSIGIARQYPIIYQTQLRVICHS